MWRGESVTSQVLHLLRASDASRFTYWSARIPIHAQGALSHPEPPGPGWHGSRLQGRGYAVGGPGGSSQGNGPERAESSGISRDCRSLQTRGTVAGEAVPPPPAAHLRTFCRRWALVPG